MKQHLIYLVAAFLPVIAHAAGEPAKTDTHSSSALGFLQSSYPMTPEDRRLAERGKVTGEDGIVLQDGSLTTKSAPAKASQN